MVDPASIRVVQGTTRPWVVSDWAGWWRRDNARDRYNRRRARIRLHGIPDLTNVQIRDWKPEDFFKQDISGRDPFYGPKLLDRVNGVSSVTGRVKFLSPNQINEIRQLLRLQTELGRPGAVLPTVLPGWKSFQPSQVWPNVQNIKLDSSSTGAVGKTSSGWWEGAGRGLPLGAALLAVILLLLRAADRCLHTNLFKLPVSRRRQSDEWPTPNVMATNLAVRMTSETGPVRPGSPQTVQFIDQVDLPPPYSECADASTSSTHIKPDQEEPPPPYSACYVAYSNPKDRPPSVQFFNRNRQNIFANYEAGPSDVHDTGQSSSQQESNTSCVEENSERRVIESGTDTTNIEHRVNGFIDDDQVEDVQIGREDVNHENTNGSGGEAKDVTSNRDRYLVV